MNVYGKLAENQYVSKKEPVLASSFRRGAGSAFNAKILLKTHDRNCYMTAYLGRVERRYFMNASNADAAVHLKSFTLSNWR